MKGVGFVSSLLSYLYPSFCLLCREPLDTNQKVCDICAKELELIDPVERCPRCFTQLPSCTSPCLHCYKHPPHYRIFGQACCLSESTLTHKLIGYLHKKIEYHLEMALASLAYVQIDRLHFPKPDYILMEPTHWLLPKRDEIALSRRLAVHLASLFRVPCIKTRLNPLSLMNPYLPLEEQPTTGKEEISLSQKEPLHGSNILLFTTHLSLGSTWHSSARALESYGLFRLWNIGLVASDRSWMA